MSLLKNIFGKKHEPIRSYADFWKWFQQNERRFFTVIKKQGNIEKDFFSRLAPKLAEIRAGFFYLTGMFDETTAELIITAEGNIKSIVFVEELVGSAPKIDGWKFTTLKPALNINDVSIDIAGYKFNKGNIRFYANDKAMYPDEIDVTLVHNDFNEDNKDRIIQGSYIFLDNYIGELNFVTSVDNVVVTGKENTEKELIPIEKLKDYLIWRQKEFVEKYEGTMHNTENDSYTTFNAQLKSGNALIAVINTDLLEWDSKASHPWILAVTMKYNGKSNRGMPDTKTYEFLNTIEDEISATHKDAGGYLNIGRQTGDNVREVYFACKDFRLPSKVMFNLERKYRDTIEICHDIYKDKYWRSFQRFAGTP